jgi:PAS domain S-box-containing protein
MFQDVTNSHRAEQASRHLAALVESSDDAIITKDLNGIITTWNQAAENLFGYSEGEIIDKPVTLLIPPEHKDEEPDILKRIRRGERIDHYETVRQRKDGSRERTADLERANAALLDDIEKQKKLEAQLRQAQRWKYWNFGRWYRARLQQRAQYRQRLRQRYCDASRRQRGNRRASWNYRRGHRPRHLRRARAAYPGAQNRLAFSFDQRQRGDLGTR